MELHITGYEFPDAQPSEGDHWDANWLIISGQVDAGQQRRWNFQEPSLTTWEVNELIMWLREVGTGNAEPADPGGLSARAAGSHGQWSELADAGWLTFLEPNLTFAVARYDAERVDLRVGLAAESGPRLRTSTDPGRCEVVILDVTRGEVRAAAADLAAELSAFPAR